MADRPIDEAYVEIRPQVDEFDKTLNREISRTYKDVEKKTRDLEDIIEDYAKQIEDSVSGAFTSVAITAEGASVSIERSVRDTADKIDDSISAGARGAKRAIDDLADEASRDFGRVERDADKAGKSIVAAFAGGLASGARQAFDNVAELGNKIRGVASAGSPMIVAVKIAAMAALVPIILGLGGALVDLSAILLALPAAASIAVAAIAPLPIAFMGMSDAIEALVSGDMDKLNESLKKLTPSARSFVMEIKGLLAPLRELKKQVQESFFAPLRGTLTQIGKDLLPTITSGLSRVARALGTQLSGFSEFFGGDIAEVFGDIFESAERVVNRAGPTIINFLGTMFGVIEHGLPFAERIFDTLFDGVDAFAGFLSNAMKSGDFEKWLEQGLSVARDLWELLKAVGSLLSTLFGGAGDEGQTFIQSLTEATKRIDEFFKSAEGQETIQRTLDALVQLGKAVIFLADAYVWLAGLLNTIYKFFAAIPGWVSTAWNATVNFAKGIWNAVTQWVGKAADWVVNAWNSVVAFFTALPGRIVSFLQSLPGLLAQAATNAFDAFFYAVGFGAVRILQIIKALPGQIWGIMVDLWNRGLEIFNNGVRLIVGAILFLKYDVPRILAELGIAAKQKFLDAVNALIEYANRLPGRIRDAFTNTKNAVVNAGKDFVSSAFNIGKDMIEGMINGIKSAAGRLVDVAKRAVQNALQGAKDALLSRSPSRAWAELGVDSIKGYTMGADEESENMIREIKHIIKTPIDEFGRRGRRSSEPANAMAAGGFSGTVIVQLGDEQISNPVIRIIERHPQPVALAVEQGNTNLARRR